MARSRRSPVATSLVVLALAMPTAVLARDLAQTSRASSCWIPSSYYPEQQCSQTSNRSTCSRNYNVFDTQAECCASGGSGAFTSGCTSNETETTSCWAAALYFPEQACAPTTDAGICARGWGAYDDEDACCAENAAFAPGCTIAYTDIVELGYAPAVEAPFVVNESK